MTPTMEDVLTSISRFNLARCQVRIISFLSGTCEKLRVRFKFLNFFPGEIFVINYTCSPTLWAENINPKLGKLWQAFCPHKKGNYVKDGSGYGFYGDYDGPDHGRGDKLLLIETQKHHCHCQTYNKQKDCSLYEGKENSENKLSATS